MLGCPLASRCSPPTCSCEAGGACHPPISGIPDVNKSIKDMSASVRGRLLDQVRATNRPFRELLQYFAMERFLYRLSESPHGTSFTLKGALLLSTSGLTVLRSIKDIDLLGHGSNDTDTLVGHRQGDLCSTSRTRRAALRPVNGGGGEHRLGCGLSWRPDPFLGASWKGQDRPTACGRARVDITPTRRHCPSGHKPQTLLESLIRWNRSPMAPTPNFLYPCRRTGRLWRSIKIKLHAGPPGLTF